MLRGGLVIVGVIGALGAVVVATSLWRHASNELPPPDVGQSARGPATVATSRTPRDTLDAPEPAPPVRSNASTPANAALLEAIRAGDVAGLRQLLASGASPDAVDADGVTALEVAIENQQQEAIELLLDAGASLDTRPGAEPIIVAALRQGDETLAMDLVQRGAPVAAAEGTAPLVTAVASGANDELLDVMLAAGADVNAADGTGETPLVAAVAAGDARLVALLLAKGARVDVAGADGFSPLQLATDSGESHIAEMLRQAGAADD